MKRILVYMVAGALIYSIICGIGWSWALGLEFDWWKLPIIGALNFFLNVAGNKFLPEIKKNLTTASTGQSPSDSAS